MVGHLCKIQERRIQPLDLRQPCGDLIRKGCCSLVPAVLLSHVQLAKVLLTECDVLPLIKHPGMNLMRKLLH